MIQFDEAIAALSSKVPEVTRWSGDRAGVWHAKSFTVAGITKTEVLNDIFSMTKDAQANGQSLGQFRREFIGKAQSQGWLIRDGGLDHKGRPLDKKYWSWRAELIYNNAMRQSYMAGKWQQLQRTKADFPYLRYSAVMDRRTRPQHAAWNGIVRHIDDAFFQTHYPPCGINCRCTVIAVSKGEVADNLVQVDRDPFPMQYRDVVSKVTGEITDRVPVGVDPGFDHNVGEAWIAPEIVLGRKLAALPRPLQGIVVDKTLTLGFMQAINDRWTDFYRSIKATKNVQGIAQIVGYLDSAVLNGLTKHVPELVLENTVVGVIDRKTDHLAGLHKADSKIVLKAWPSNWVARLPEKLRNYQAVYWDAQENTLLVIAKGQVEGRIPKIALHPNYKTKLGTNVSVVSLGFTELRNLKQSHMTLIAGSMQEK